MNSVTLTKDEILASVIDTLNEAFKADPNAIHSLICSQFPCNSELAGHPTIQVNVNSVISDNSYTVGCLGLINGIVEKLTNKKVAITFTDEENPKCKGFAEYNI